MRILQMRATFGCLEDAELTLEPGLNTLVLPNGSGKSTWAAFLLAMLYGLDTRRSTRTALSDRERYTPWSGAPMAGRLELEQDGRRIILERGSKNRSTFNTFRAVDADTGQEIPGLTAENCGRVLTGAERSVFIRSVWLPQGDAAVTGDAALEQRLQALVTGEESGLSRREAAAALQAYRNRLQHGKTGRIPDLERELAALDAAQARRADFQRELNRLQTQEQELLNSLHAETSQSEARQAEQQADLQAQLDAARAAEQKAAADLRILQADAARLPDPDTLQQLEAYFRFSGSGSQQPADTGGGPETQETGGTEQHTAGSRKPAGATPADADRADSAAGPESRKPGRSDQTDAQPGGPDAGRTGQNRPEPRPAAAGPAAAGRSDQAAPEQDSEEPVRTPLDLLLLLLLIVTAAAAGCITVLRWPAGALSLLLPCLVLALLLYTRKAGQARDEAAGVEQTEPAGRQEIDSRLLAQLAAFAPCDTREEALQALRYAASLPEALPRQEQAVQAARQLTAALETALDAAAAGAAPAAPAQALEQQLQENRWQQARLQGALETEADPADRRADLNTQLEKLRFELAAADAALEALEQAGAALEARFAPALRQKTSELFSRLTGERFPETDLDREFRLRVRPAGQTLTRSSLALSRGEQDLLTLCLRLAIAELTLPDVPLLLDDALHTLDTGRLAAVLALLQDMAENRQILLFSCTDLPGA